MSSHDSLDSIPPNGTWVSTLTAGDLMTPGVITIGADESLQRAAALMVEKHIHCLVVPSADPRRAVSIIAIKDIVQVLSEAEPELLSQLRVRDAMTTPAICVQRDMLLIDCLRMMRMSGVRSAPVVDRLELVGVLSFSDYLRAIAHPPAARR